MAFSASQIAKQAAEWAARVHAGDLSAEEQARMDAWLAADLRHLGAYARVEAALARVGRLSSVGPEAVRSAAGKPPANMMRRRVVLTGSIAASLAALGFVGTKLWSPAPATLAAAPEIIATKVGESKAVTLADGSIATLNTDTRISVAYDDTQRHIRLERGEALFKVAKNKQRPFIVAAGDTVVRAVGTAFSVRVLPEKPVQVLVQEGIVEVSRGGSSPVSPVRAVAHTQTVIPTDTPIEVRPVTPPEVTRDLAWQTGHIVFAGETLADAAAEFARYNNTKIIVDPAVANRTVTGMFSSNDPVGFAKVAASVLSLHVEVGTNEVWIIR